MQHLHDYNKSDLRRVHILAAYDYTAELLWTSQQFANFPAEYCSHSCAGAPSVKYLLQLSPSAFAILYIYSHIGLLNKKLNFYALHRLRALLY